MKVMETGVKLSQLVELLDLHIAKQQAKRLSADEHPIANALDRAHSMGGEIALIEFKNSLLEVVVNAHEMVEGRRA